MNVSYICFNGLALIGLCFGLIPLTSAHAQGFAPHVASQGQLANNSTRIAIGTGNAISIQEFVIQGDQPKKIIVRGRGPSLGIAGALQDPVLSLYDHNGALLARNDNWRDSQEAEIVATGIAPSDGRESAIVATLAPGNYAVALVGKSHTTGLGVSELYDLESQNSVFTGIGVRGKSLPNPELLLSGFILTGSQPQSLLLRALGPSLADHGIASALMDPAITLRSSNGTLIAFNDDWQDTQAAQIKATGLAPTDYRESAILITLVPGAYSLRQERSSGITSLEEYAVPYDGGVLNPAPHFHTSATAVSRKTHGATAYDVPLPLSGAHGIECRSGGASDAYQVVVTFPSNVSFSSAQVTSGVGSVASASGSGTKVATVNLTGVTSGQTIEITVTDADDGTSVNNLVIPMSVMVGDTNGNGSVNATDISNIKTQSGQQHYFV